MSRVRLAPDAALHVDVDDRTVLGSPLGRGPERTVRTACRPLLAAAAAQGAGPALAAAPALLADAVRSGAWAAFAEPSGASWRLAPTWLWPNPALSGPGWLTVGRAGTADAVRMHVAAPLWPRVHALLAALSGEGLSPGELARTGDACVELVTALAGARLVTAVPAAPAGPVPCDPPSVTWLGHNTVLARSATSAVLVDPLLFAPSGLDVPDYAPLLPDRLGPVDGLVITHSHRDHFDPASLLRFPPDLRVVVPAVERESVLAVDMALRLRQLGFVDVVPLEPWQSCRVGDIGVTAMPFRGEQPTDGDVLHPEVRNAGCTYALRLPAPAAGRGLHVVLLADSGRDGGGDVWSVAREGRARLGPADVVFSGYRGWTTYPSQLVTSSVARYLPFVPPAQWGARQQLMTDAEGAVDVAEQWGARWLVPYADGGAPWHWRVGLGPVLVGADRAEHDGFDPFPERVVHAAASRVVLDGVAVPSSVSVRLLRPHDSLDADGATWRPARQGWPSRWESPPA